MGASPPAPFPQSSGDLRLGIDQPAGSWPTAPRLKSYEAAGFSYVQVPMPPPRVLGDGELVAVHAAALRAVLDLTGLELVLHIPEELMAGERASDACLRGALDYAVVAGSALVVYHGRRILAGRPGTAARLGAERRALGRLARRAAAAGVTIAIENLAPPYPGPALVSHDPEALLELVHAIDSPAVGVCLDVGHANVVAALADRDVVALIEPLLDDTRLFHLHDNVGPAATRERSGSLEPLRQDLHLAPGAGSVPWRRLAPLLARHGAPLQLEVRAPTRPEPGTLAVVVRELLGLSAAPV